MNNLNIGGFTPFSTIDYPYGLCSVVFLQGCPWRCTFCHNKGLLDHNAYNIIKWGYITNFLKDRVTKLDAVVFSGGEPTMQIDELIHAAADCARLSFEVGVHTNGYNPEAVTRLIKAADWISLDVKAPQDKFKSVTQSSTGWDNVIESAKIIIDSGIKYELRVTKHPLNTEDDVSEIIKTLSALKANKVCIYKYKEPIINATDNEGRP